MQSTLSEVEKLNSAWKESNVFQKQLDLNLHQIKSIENYPNHWFDFIKLINAIQPKKILDIGCGCGIFYKLCQQHVKNIEYTGIDYSNNAIKLAKKQWNHDNFFEKNLFDLDQKYINNFDVIYLGAILDVIPNANEALNHILKLLCKNIIIGRIKFTDQLSFYKTYIAYEEIETCEFYHNANEFRKICSKNNYSIKKINDSIYLNLQNEV